MATKALEIEDIEALRQSVGIDDEELRDEVRQLRVGDCVRLTFLGGGKVPSTQTLPVRITRVAGTTFRGRLVAGPPPGRPGPRAGACVAFTATHIHSVQSRRCIAGGRPRGGPAVRAESPNQS